MVEGTIALRTAKITAVGNAQLPDDGRDYREESEPAVRTGLCQPCRARIGADGWLARHSAGGVGRNHAAAAPSRILRSTAATRFSISLRSPLMSMCLTRDISRSRSIRSSNGALASATRRSA